jgi:hypothetical protein
MRGMGDWDRFVADVSWFLEPSDTAEVGAARPWTRGPVDGLPELSALLESATLTPIAVGDATYELLAWGPAADRRGWLCAPPVHHDATAVHRLHRTLWTRLGGIVERFGEPESWWLNQDQVLTAEAANTDLAAVLSSYDWLWEDTGGEPPIQVDEYYVVAVEANGNLTLVRRESGQVLLFAPDHAFDGVTPLPGCPPYSLLTIDDAPDLATWIEACARPWHAVGGRSGPTRAEPST